MDQENTYFCRWILKLKIGGGNYLVSMRFNDVIHKWPYKIGINTEIKEEREHVHILHF